MPAPPARRRSLSVPCGFSSTCNSPLRTSCSKSLFSPTYVEIIFLTWRCCSSTPMPKSSTPALLLTMVRSFVPLRRTAAMRFSGMPQRPKPPIRMVTPSRILSMAASAEAIRLSIQCSEVFGEVYFIRCWSRKPCAAWSGPLKWGLLAAGAGRCDQGFHGSITGIHSGDETVGSRSYVDERVAALGQLAIDHLFVVVYESVALPVGRAAQFAGGLQVVEANEEEVDAGGLVPPNHVETIQLSCR